MATVDVAAEAVVEATDSQVACQIESVAGFGNQTDVATPNALSTILQALSSRLQTLQSKNPMIKI